MQKQKNDLAIKKSVRIGETLADLILQMPLVEIQAVVRRKIDESERRRVKIRQISVGCLEPEICRGGETAVKQIRKDMAADGRRGKRIS